MTSYQRMNDREMLGYIRGIEFQCDVDMIDTSFRSIYEDVVAKCVSLFGDNNGLQWKDTSWLVDLDWRWIVTSHQACFRTQEDLLLFKMACL